MDKPWGSQIYLLKLNGYKVYIRDNLISYSKIRIMSDKKLKFLCIFKGLIKFLVFVNKNVQKLSTNGSFNIHITINPIQKIGILN